MKTIEIFKNCEFCDTEFPTNRSTAKFCSNTCRTKANNQRRENEKIEAQKAIEQAEKDELKRKASEARKLKKAEKAADIAEKLRLKEQKLQEQNEIEAAELAEKQRIADEAQKQQRLKDEADAKKRLADEERRKKAEKEKYDRDMKLANEIGKAIYRLCQTKPINETNPNNSNNPGNPIMRKILKPTYSGLNSSGLPTSKELNNQGFSINPEVAPQIKPASKTPNFFEGALGPLIDDISDFWKSF